MMIKKIKNGIKKIIGFFQYHTDSLKNYYPCTLVGERPSKEGNTVILYRILGKRDIFEISIKELLEDSKLVSSFHPTAAVKFGAIAMGDILLMEDHGKRSAKFDLIKRKMLESVGS